MFHDPDLWSMFHDPDGTIVGVLRVKNLPIVFMVGCCFFLAWALFAWKAALQNLYYPPENAEEIHVSLFPSGIEALMCFKVKYEWLLVSYSLSESFTL